MSIVVWDKKEMKRLERAMTSALKEYGGVLDQDIKTKQVVPKDTGALEDSQKVELISDDTLRISYSTDYATRLYFHPEYNFSHDVNANAQGMWLEPIFNDQEIIKKYADILKEKL